MAALCKNNYKYGLWTGEVYQLHITELDSMCFHSQVIVAEHPLVRVQTTSEAIASVMETALDHLAQSRMSTGYL